MGLEVGAVARGMIRRLTPKTGPYLASIKYEAGVPTDAQGRGDVLLDIHQDGDCARIDATLYFVLRRKNFAVFPEDTGGGIDWDTNRKALHRDPFLA